MESAKLYPSVIGKKKIGDIWKANQRPVTLKVATMMIFRIDWKPGKQIEF